MVATMSKTDECEEYDRCPRQNAVPAVVAGVRPGQQRQHRLVDAASGVVGLRWRDERRVVGGLDVEGADDHHQQHHRDFDRGDHRGEVGRQFGAQGKQRRYQRDDQQRAPVEVE
jgi:hypothetical protein